MFSDYNFFDISSHIPFIAKFLSSLIPGSRAHPFLPDYLLPNIPSLSTFPFSLHFREIKTRENARGCRLAKLNPSQNCYNPILGGETSLKAPFVAKNCYFSVIFTLICDIKSTLINSRLCLKPVFPGYMLFLLDDRWLAGGMLTLIAWYPT